MSRDRATGFTRGCGRVRELEPVARESEQLEAALAALDDVSLPGPAARASAPVAVGM